MRKRERENPCGVCGHYHKYEEGEVCGICGHRVPVSTEISSGGGGVHVSAFSSEILPDFLFLGSYDNASRSELLKTQGISRILNTVPACQNLYRNSFTYHCLQEEKILPFDDAIHFLEQCEKDKARVLVHCMSGKNRSPAIVIAYLMKCKGWRLAQSYQWVKDRRPSVDLNQGTHEQLQEYEKKIFGATESTDTTIAQLGFGFPKPNNNNNNNIISFGASPAAAGATSIFDRANNPQEFTFGAAAKESNTSDTVME